YGMIATIEPALARLRASTMISSSIKLSFGGEHVDCTMKQLTPRTFSPISTKISPSEKRETLAVPCGTPTYLLISSVRAGLALPPKIEISRSITGLGTVWGGRIRTYEWRYQKPLAYRLPTPQLAVRTADRAGL